MRARIHELVRVLDGYLSHAGNVSNLYTEPQITFHSINVSIRSRGHTMAVGHFTFAEPIR